MPKNTITTLKQKVSEATKIPLVKIKLIFPWTQYYTGDAESLIPTFSIENKTVVHCLAKPDSTQQAASTQTQTQQKTIPTATVIAPTTTTESSLNIMEACLQELMSQNSSKIYMTALQTLSKMTTNIIQKPHKEKYHKVELSNAAFDR